MEDLKIEDVKNCIGFDTSHGTGKILSLMVDCWYAKAIKEGLSETEAIKYASNQLGDEITKMAKNVQQ